MGRGHTGEEGRRHFIRKIPSITPSPMKLIYVTATSDNLISGRGARGSPGRPRVGPVPEHEHLRISISIRHGCHGNTLPFKTGTQLTSLSSAAQPLCRLWPTHFGVCVYVCVCVGVCVYVRVVTVSHGEKVLIWSQHSRGFVV